MSAIRLGVVFPATFNLNADAANATVLARRLVLSGYDVDVVPLDLDAMTVDAPCDALFIGSPSSTGLTAAETRSALAREFVQSAHGGAVPILAVSNGFHWLGTMTAKDGTDLGGLGILPVHTVFHDRQHVTIGATVTSEWGTLVGVENHNATVELTSSASALGHMSHGVGNNRGEVDGFADDSVWATHLHGPVFAMNPHFADAFAVRVLERRGETFRRGETLDDIDTLARATAAHLVRKQSS